MRGRRTTLAARAALLAAVALCAGGPGVARARAGAPPITVAGVERPSGRVGYIAHALGSISGYRYSNTPEAFARSYRLGFRLFECDLLTLADGTVILAHDHTERLYGLRKSFRVATYEDVRGLRYRRRFTLLTSRALVTLLRAHPDARMVLDTKWDHVAAVRRVVEDAHGDASVLDRLVPHVASVRELAAMRALYPFPEAILALYRMPWISNAAIVRLVREQGVTAVMTSARPHPGGRARTYSGSLRRALRRAGIPLFVFDVANARLVARFRKVGVGVYSDGWITAHPTG